MKKFKENLKVACLYLGIMVFVAGIISLGTWYEINKWKVYQETHHTDIGYWKWQFFVNSDSHSSRK
jgi:hypothetical protein